MNAWQVSEPADGSSNAHRLPTPTASDVEATRDREAASVMDSDQRARITTSSFDLRGPANIDRPADGRLKNVLVVQVPAAARLYINGRLTQTTGRDRCYSASGLESGKHYAYEVRAELDRGGRVISQQKMLVLSGGESGDVRFDFDSVNATVEREARLPNQD